MRQTDLARRAFTLIEVLVVLLLMGLATALVAPAFIPRRTDARSGLGAVIEHARGTAVSRGETVSLRIDRFGAWRTDGMATPSVVPLASGRLDTRFDAGVTLLFSALGTCGADLRSQAAAGALGLDPLTCELRGP